MSWSFRTIFLAGLLSCILSHPYDPKLLNYNINLNQTGGNQVLTYYSDWPEKSKQGYTPSPTNWRSLPTYTVLLDKFVDGDPTNNDYFEIRWEWDLTANQLRHGGDITGFAQDRVLDYIYGMGYRCIFFAGTPWVNMPWQADGYSALDFTLLDPHYGTLAEWRAAIDKIHAKGMYVMLDMTTTTMGDLIGHTKFLNASTPFNIEGYEVQWKNPPHASWDLHHYPDFNFTNTRSPCRLPNFYENDGSLITSISKTTIDCYAGDFDQFGDIEAFGVHPDWQRQLSKFASVQDRLREWDNGVTAKLEHLA